MYADHARKGADRRSVSGGVILGADICLSFSYTGCRCLRHVFNGEAEIKTYGRQGSMPIFSSNRYPLRRFVLGLTS